MYYFEIRCWGLSFLHWPQHTANTINMRRTMPISWSPSSSLSCFIFILPVFNFSSFLTAFVTQIKVIPFLYKLLCILWFSLFHSRVSEWTNKQFRKVFVPPKSFLRLFACGLRRSENTLGRHFHWCYIQVYIVGRHWRAAWLLKEATRKVAATGICIDTM